MNIKDINIQKILIYILFLIPLLLISGPFLPDLSLVLIAIYGFFLIIKKNFLIPNELKKFTYIFSFFFLLLLFSSIFSENPIKYSFGSLTHIRFLFFVFGSYLLLKKFNFSNFKFLYFLLGLVLFLTSLDAIFQFFFRENLLGFPIEARLSGIFRNELILGSYLSRILPFFIALYFINKFEKKFAKITFIIFIVTIDIAIILSTERAAFFYMFITNLLLFLFFFKSIKFKFIFIAIFIFSVLLALTNENPVKDRFINTTLEQFDSKIYKPNLFIKYLPYSEDHETIYSSAINMIKSDPFTGHGPWSFREKCKNYTHLKNNSCSTHPHNTYLQLFAELGFFGFLLIFILFLYVFKNLISYSLMKYKSNYDYGVLFLFLSMFITLWPIIPTGNFFNNWLSIIYFYPLPFYFYISHKKNN